MLLVASLVPFVVLAGCVAATRTVVRDAPISLPLAKYISTTGTQDLVRRDRERARKLVKQDSTLTAVMASSVGVTNTVNYYVANVGVGTPATYCGSLNC